ncbi:MAG: selenocysteine-specific translation elongation factor [Lautropia sp.]
MIVATAGHIDHGKTSLIRALTGVDTDRLPEERARGISIDLGFAHVDLAGGERFSFVDVPGHERFIRNMLAGVCAVDAALLVVAADDGVMPQTVEHLQILDLLDVRCGAAVVSKTDLVDAARVRTVCADVQTLAGGTALEKLPVFPASVITGAGLDALREWLQALAARKAGASSDGRNFRLAVDRAFTVAGSGTVVTGTVHTGEVSLGDRLMVSPAALPVRVRGIHVQGAAAVRAGPATRCALNLSGVAVGRLGRGDWIVHPSAHRPTERIDARLRVSAGEAAALRHWSRVHLYLGTADVPARVAIAGGASIAPGGRGFVQLVTERPIHALHADRFVVRDQAARRTLGGGTVLNPFASARTRRGTARDAELAVYERHDPAALLSGLLGLTETGVDLAQFACALNLSPPRAVEVRQQARAFVVGKARPIGLSREAAAWATSRVLAVLREFHASTPRATGMELAALRSAVADRLPGPVFEALVRELANRQAVVLSNDLVRLAGHVATANPADEALWASVQRALARAGAFAPTIAELAERLRIKPAALRDFLHRKSRTGEVLRVTDDRFCLRETLAGLAAAAAAVARASVDGTYSAAQYRDAIGTGRGLAIHYLEFFDRLGVTQRVGDRRRMAKDFASRLGIPAEAQGAGFSGLVGFEALSARSPSSR